MSRPPNTTPGNETHQIQCLYVHYGDDGRMLRRCPNWLVYTVDLESGRPSIYCPSHGGLAPAIEAMVERLVEGEC